MVLTAAVDARLRGNGSSRVVDYDGCIEKRPLVKSGYVAGAPPVGVAVVDGIVEAPPAHG